jgi:hypothetical protein
VERNSTPPLYGFPHRFRICARSQTDDPTLAATSPFPFLWLAVRALPCQDRELMALLSHARARAIWRGLGTKPNLRPVVSRRHWSRHPRDPEQHQQPYDDFQPYPLCHRWLAYTHGLAGASQSVALLTQSALSRRLDALSTRCRRSNSEP